MRTCRLPAHVQVWIDLQSEKWEAEDDDIAAIAPSIAGMIEANG
jgi:hypothetical protein